MRHALKAMCEAGMSRSGLLGIARRFRRSDVLVLAYHNVVPEGEAAVGDLSLHLPQRVFARQLDTLMATHDVVPLEAALAPPSGARPRAVITFDDAYAGAVSAGVGELARRGLPGTVFVTPAFVPGGSFWWDEIDALTPELRGHCIGRLRGEDTVIRAWAAARGIRLRAVPEHQRAAPLAGLEGAAAAGISLAAHSWSHPNLAALTPAELALEMERPLAWLRSRFMHWLPWLTYPYGLYSPRVEEAARRAGYAGALRVDGGWLAPGGVKPATFSLPRFNVPAGLSQRGFEIRAAGVAI